MYEDHFKKKIWIRPSGQFRFRINFWNYEPFQTFW